MTAALSLGGMESVSAAGDAYTRTLLGLTEHEMQMHAEHGSLAGGAIKPPSDPSADAKREPVGGDTHEQLTRIGVNALRWYALAGASALVLERVRRLNLHQGRTPILAASRVVGGLHAFTTCLAAAVLAPHVWRASSRQTLVDAMGCQRNTKAETRLLELSLGYVRDARRPAPSPAAAPRLARPAHSARAPSRPPARRGRPPTRARVPPPPPQFVYDTIYMLAFEPDPLFLVHHGAALAIWGGSLRLGRGSGLPLAGLFLGESTTWLLNLWWLAKRAGNETLSRRLARAFTVAFIAVRLGLLPAIFVPYAHSTARGEYDERIGRIRSKVWCSLIGAVLLGGGVWAKSLIKGALADYRRQKLR